MCEVIEHLGKQRIKVRFADTGVEAVVLSDKLSKGNIADPTRNRVVGCGYAKDKETIDAGIKSALARLFPKSSPVSQPADEDMSPMQLDIKNRVTALRAREEARQAEQDAKASELEIDPLL
jgi:hypothetical protein